MSCWPQWWPIKRDLHLHNGQSTHRTVQFTKTFRLCSGCFKSLPLHPLEQSQSWGPLECVAFVAWKMKLHADSLKSCPTLWPLAGPERLWAPLLENAKKSCQLLLNCTQHPQMTRPKNQSNSLKKHQKTPKSNISKQTRITPIQNNSILRIILIALSIKIQGLFFVEKPCPNH